MLYDLDPDLYLLSKQDSVIHLVVPVNEWELTITITLIMGINSLTNFKK